MNYTTTEVAASTAADKITLAELEAQVAADLIAEGKADITAEDIARVGDPVVSEGRLRFYTAARWNEGRWISSKVLDRIRTAVKAGVPAEQPAAAPARAKTRSRKAAAAS